MYRPVGPYIYIYTTQRKYVVVAIYWNLSYFSGTYFAQYTYHNIIYICIASYLNLALEVPSETGSMGFSGS